MKYNVHTKGQYGIEDPELKFSKKRPAGGLISKELRFKRHESAVGMGMRNKRMTMFPSVTILWCLSCNYQRVGKINLIYLASKELFRPKTLLMLNSP